MVGDVVVAALDEDLVDRVGADIAVAAGPGWVCEQWPLIVRLTSLAGVLT